MTMRMSESLLVCFVLVSSSFQVACNSSNFGAAFSLGKKPRPALVEKSSSGNSTKDMEAMFDETLIDTFNKNDEYVQKNLGDDTFTIHGVEFSNLASFYDLYRDQIESSPYAEVSLRESLEDAGIDIEDLEVPSDESERVENYQFLSDTIESRLNGENQDANGEDQDALSLQVNTPQSLRLQGNEELENRPEVVADIEQRMDTGTAMQKAANTMKDNWKNAQSNRTDAALSGASGGVLAAASTDVSAPKSTEVTNVDKTGLRPCKPGQQSKAARPCS